MSGNVRLTIISAVLMAVSAAISAASLDWMWVIISAAGIAALAAPRLLGGEGRTYHRALLRLAPIPFALYIALYAANLIVEIGVYRYLSLTIQPLASVVCAYLIFSSLGASSDAVISKRWLFLLSVAFACAFAVLSVFFVFYGMKEMGFPMYNADFEGPNALDNTEANHFLMLPVNLAVVLSLIYVLIVDRSLKKVPAGDLTSYCGGDGP